MIFLSVPDFYLIQSVYYIILSGNCNHSGKNNKVKNKNIRERKRFHRKAVAAFKESAKIRFTAVKIYPNAPV